MGKRLLGVVTVTIFGFICLGFYLHAEKDVILCLEGKETLVKSKSITVGGLLEERGIGWEDRDLLIPEPTTLLKAGEKITIQKCVPFEIEVEGRILTIEHHSLDVNEVVEAAGIVMGKLDRVEGMVDKGELPVKLLVVRVCEEIAEVDEAIAYCSQNVLDAELKKGDTKVLQKGRNGLERKTVLIRKENGVETLRRVLAREVIVMAVDEIIALGTNGTIAVTSRSLSNPRNVMVLEATAYTHTGNTTFTGVYPRIGTIAVDPRVIPLGSRMWVEGYGYGIAQDTGGLIKGKIIDLFMDTEKECLRWGRRQVRVYFFD